MDELQPSTHLDVEASGSMHAQIEQSETMETQSGVASTSRKRRGRGPSRGIATTKALRASGKQKLLVLLEVHRGLPVDMYSEKFVFELSSLVKQHATLAVCGWAEVPKESKNLIYGRIQDTFKFVDSPEVKKMVIRHANKLYQERRTHLYTDYYKKYETDEERLQNMPCGVSAREWIYLLNHFNSEDFKDAVSQKIIESQEAKGSMALIQDDAFQLVVRETSEYVQGMGFGSLARRSRQRMRKELRKELEQIRREYDEVRIEREEVRIKREEARIELEEARIERKEARIKLEEARKEINELAWKIARLEARQEEMDVQMAMVLQIVQQMRPGEVTLSDTDTTAESVVTTTH